MLRRYRRILEQARSCVRNKASQIILLLVHAMEHGGNSEKLKRAAHREALVRAVLQALAVARVESGNAQTAAQTLLDGLKSSLRCVRT